LIDRSQFMPAMTIESAVDRFNSLVEFVSRVLRKDVDYGVIPGTGKPTLLKPGAEKLTTFFGLSTRFQLIERIEDWSGAGHGGEPFFYYMYRCQLSRGDLLIAESDGSCNSRESKYRYREAQRVCPDCKQAAIIKGKEEYGGGYICFKKKGGCGAKFSNGDPAIEGQPIGRVPNPDIADQVNTIQKMAQKRSLIAATLLAVNASEFFTQDVEDMMIAGGTMEVIDETPAVVPPPAQSYNPPTMSRPPASSQPVVNQITPDKKGVEAVSLMSEHARLTKEILDACHALGRSEEQLADWVRKKYGVGEIDSLTAFDKREVLAFLQNRLTPQPNS
jgi:hypothetical protein